MNNKNKKNENENIKINNEDKEKKIYLDDYYSKTFIKKLFS